MKKLLCILPLVLLFCFSIACQDKAAIAELEKFKAQAKLEEQNKTVIIQQAELLNKGDYGALRELLAPEYLAYFPSRSNKPISRDEYIESIKASRSAFPDMKWTVQELIPVGDKVIMRYVGRGTHKGEYAGIPATGNQIEYGGTGIFRIEKGKVIEEKVDNDVLGVMIQLGMELKPIAAKRKENRAY
jgi:steroid delta-isomerase-like uncharacterized protein